MVEKVGHVSTLCLDENKSSDKYTGAGWWSAQIRDFLGAQRS